MGGTGTSMVVALAAVLWLVYLVPTWMRRRQYLATELNAVRLQQTLRILAETSEVPDAVRDHADARAVAAQRRRVLEELVERRAVEQERASVMASAAARTLATLTPATTPTATLMPATTVTPVTTAPPVPAAPHSRAALRLRRSRLVVSAILLAGILATVIGLTPVASGLGPVLSLLGLALSAGCVLLLSRLAAVARSRAATARRLREQAAARPEVPVSTVETQAGERPGWTPVPLPKPLYLSKPAPQRVVSQAAIAEARTRALAEASAVERAARAAERSEKVTAIGSADRYARMGVVDRSAATVTDLGDALRRRRAV